MVRQIFIPQPWGQKINARLRKRSPLDSGFEFPALKIIREIPTQFVFYYFSEEFKKGDYCHYMDWDHVRVRPLIFFEVIGPLILS